MMRDCGFVLNDIGSLGDLEINDPGCALIPVGTGTWGAIKDIFRPRR
jgi:hypothetical protein